MTTSPRRQAGAARAAALATAALTLTAAVGTVAMHRSAAGAPAAAGVTEWWLMTVTGSLAYGGTGAWLALRRPRLSVGWLLLALGLLVSLVGAGLETGVRGEGQDVPLSEAALWFGNWAWATVLLTAGTVLPLVLPDGRLPSRRWRPALVLSAAAVVVTSAVSALSPYEPLYPGLARAGVVNPTGTDVVRSAVVAVPTGALAVAALGVATAALVVRWRRDVGRTRQQLKWIVVGAVATVLLFALGFFVGPVATALALVPLPAACLVAALGHGLWDVDVVLSRSLLYAALTAAVIGAYVVVVASLGGALGDTTGTPVVATAVVAVVVTPLHRWLQAAVNRLVHGARDEPLTVLDRIGQRLAATTDEATVTALVLPEVVAAVASALHAPYAAVALADGTVVEHGTATSAVHRVPLAYAGADVGELVVAPGARGFSRSDRRALSALAASASVAVHTVLLSRDLRRSRGQLVTAREEERRRLFRDLHDGLGPSLAALALQVGAARDGLDDVPARTILDRVELRLRSTVDEVRALVNGLRPAALDDLGLAEALRERFPGAVVVDVDEPGPLPAAVEVAAYSIASEAVHNALRHGHPARVDVLLRRQDDTLVLVVEDDGTGLSPMALPGVGLASMRTRAEELGGTLTVTVPAQRGVRVEARLPA